MILYQILLLKSKKNIMNYISNYTNDILIKSLNNSLNRINKSDKKDLIVLDSGHNININTEKVNKIINEIDKNFSYNINKNKTKNYLIINIPTSYISKRFINDNKHMPFKMELFTSTNIKTKSIIKTYGINNTFARINLIIESNIRISNNFINKNIKYKREYPLIIKLISGKTPNYYN